MEHIYAQHTENHEKRQAIACRRVSAGRASVGETALSNLKTIATRCRILAVITVMVLQCGTAWGQAKPDNSKNVRFAKTTAVPAKADKKEGKAKVATMEAVKRSAAKTTESRKQAKPAKQNPENLPEFKESWKDNTGIFSRYHANKWKSGGLYYGLSPEQELTQYRTEHSKTFDNGDGTNSYMYIGDLHYKDAQGRWQDIEVNIEKVNNGQYRYANTKNKFQTYYSDSPSEGIKMKYIGQNLVFAKDYRFEFIDEQGQAIKGNDRTSQNARQADFRTLSYQNFYNGIDYSIIQLGRGVETGFSVNNRNAVVDGANTVRISQTVELPQGAYVVADGKKQGKTFSASEFEVMIPGHDSWITFQPVVVYDAHVDMDYIMKRAEIRHEGDKYDKEGKPVEDPMAKYSYKAVYNVSQSGNTLTVSFDLPAEWMLASERTFPLFIDPTVTVLSGTTSVTSSYTFYNTLYHDSRWDVQITDAEMMAAGINNGATISACGLLCSAMPGRINNGYSVTYPRIDLNNAALPNDRWLTTGWTNCYYANQLPTPTVGGDDNSWNTYTFQTNFTYSNANGNLLVRLSKDCNGYNGGGGNYCVSSTTGTTARGGYSDSGYDYPFDGMTRNNAVRPAMQLTYTNVNSSCSHTDQTAGTHTSGIDDMSPLAPDYNYSYTQTIYTPDEVCGSGTGADLYGIAFYYYGRSTYGTGGDIVRNVTIYLSETTNDQLSNWETTGLTQVFSGNVAFIKGSWTWITFNTPFSYSGNNNLVVTVNDKSNHKDNSDDLCYFYVDNSPADGIHRELIYYNDQTSVTDIGNPPGYNFYATFRPYTKFCVECNTPSCTELIMADGLTQTIECGTDYCFYDDGGKNGNYTQSASGTKTQTATFSSCGDITLTFSQFASESNYDELTVYDGTTSGTVLIDNHSGSTTPQAVTATSGQMTVVWESDYSLTYAGWEATITAANCCTNPTLSGCPVGNMVSGGTATLGTSCGTITSCTSSNSGVASVTAAGVITAKAPGSTTITATITQGPCTHTKTCNVSVICNSEGGTFSISPTSGSVTAGNDITATVTNTTGQNINWITNNGNATVSQSGSTLTIHGVSEGSTTITGTIPQWTGSDGVTYCQKQVTYTVNVTDGCVKIGEGTNTTYYYPVNNWYKYTYCQIIYDPSELTAGNITSVAFEYYYSSAMTSKTNVSIYLKEVPSHSTFSSTTDWEIGGFNAPVYTGNLNCSSGWNTFNLTQPFYYSGTGYLVMAILDNSNGYNGQSYVFRYTSHSEYKTLHICNDGTPYDMSSPGSGTRAQARPNTKFCITPCTPRSGTFEYTTTSHTITAGTTYTNTTLNNQTGASVTRYEIYPTGQGATINASSGQVTTTAETDGTFTITAIIEGGSTYCDLSTSYTLTVNDGCYQVGTDKSAPTSNSLLPIYTSAKTYSYSQQVYTASDILAADGCRGQINSIKFQYYGTSDLTIPIELYLGSTSSSSLSSGWITDADLTRVYTSPAGGTTFSSGWVELTLDDPYVWNGTDNIVVAVKTTDAPSGTYCYFYYTSVTGTTRTCNATSEIGLSSSNVPEAAGTSYGYRPNIRFCIDCCTPRDGHLSITSDPACPASIPYGSTLQLSGSVESNYGAGTASWSSSNTGVATVSDGGLVTPSGIGTAVITYTRAYDDTYCKASTTCTVNVTVPTPQISQQTPLPQCDIEDATLVASVPAGSVVPPAYTYHWYSNEGCTSEITDDVSGDNNNTLRYPAASATQVWCRLEQRSTTTTLNYSTSGIQTYTIPTGTVSITMEVWGAQGGYRSSSTYGGKGGHSVGTLRDLSGITTLYVAVGGSGNTGGTSGGYNGGGSRATYNGGGGATHVATATGVLSSLESNQSSVLIVAGGGGSDGATNKPGGAGGGSTGETRTESYGTGGFGGTQNAGGAGGSYNGDCNNGGSFGQGGAGLNERDGYGGAGGGGWYGGGGTCPDVSGDDERGGGGGSGYLKSTLTDAYMENGIREGNGQAKITAVHPGGDTLDIAGAAGTYTIQCCGLNATIEFGD